MVSDIAEDGVVDEVLPVFAAASLDGITPDLSKSSDEPVGPEGPRKHRGGCEVQLGSTYLVSEVFDALDSELFQRGADEFVAGDGQLLAVDGGEFSLEDEPSDDASGRAVVCDGGQPRKGKGPPDFDSKVKCV
jgi:hypothetical protein